MPIHHFLPFSVLASCVALVSACAVDDDVPDVGAAVQTLGYTVTRPPSRLIAPGTVVAITSATPFQARVVCSSNGAIGDIQLAESDTQTAAWQQASRASFSLSANTINDLSARLGGERLRSVSMQLSNTKVYELNDEQLVAAAMNGNTSEACLRALQARQKDGQAVTMIKSVLQADVAYSLHFERSLDVEAKLRLAKIAAPELLAQYEFKDDASIHGEALYFGVIDDAFLLAELLDEVAASSPTLGSAPTERRLIGAELAMQY